MSSPLRIQVFVLAALFLACQKVSHDPPVKKPNQFVVLKADKTGIDFRNDLQETRYMNGLFYEYYYNGGGVAAGDFNNDGLADIYFISNLESNRLYLNQGNLTFKDVTEIAGVAGKAVFPTGVTTVDINNDGRLDIYISASGKLKDPEKRRNELYVNLGVNQQGIPVFREEGRKYGLDLPLLSTQASFFDYDRDGDLDLFLINHDVDIYRDDQIEAYLHTEAPLSSEKLYRNDHGKFTDVTKEANIINNRLSFGLGIAIGDLNNDGWPDIYVSHDFSEKDHLYINNLDGTFREVSASALQHLSNFSMGNDLADFNNDGWLDVLSVDMASQSNYDIKTSMSGMDPDKFNRHVELGLHHQYMYNTLHLHTGFVTGAIPHFSEIAQLAGIASTDWSWGPLFADFDNDGYKDLFVANGIKRDFRNNDFVNYHKAYREKLLQQKTIDQESYINHIMGKMPYRRKLNYFFRNNGDLTFSRMNNNWPDDTLTCSNGAAYGDFDNDGDIDIVVNNMDDVAFVYKNNAVENEPGNQYVKFRFEGPDNNRLGIGARVRIKYRDKLQIQEHYVTRGFQSSVEPGLHFGLGNDVSLIDQVEVIWPDGNRQIMDSVSTNQTIIFKYQEAGSRHTSKNNGHGLFKDITGQMEMAHTHRENDFNDFDRESLLPHKMSQMGPALAIGDVNGDDLDDFYVGGALGVSGKLYIQQSDGHFLSIKNEDFLNDKACEDVGAIFFDADGDKDVDLYVVSGGNEYQEGALLLQDRLYENKGQGKFIKNNNGLPEFNVSGSKVRASDYDLDGDLDLFVGGRQTPGKYPIAPDSYLLRNDSRNDLIKFSDVTDEVAPVLRSMGMVTDAEWVDIDGDELTDLVIVGEWMPVRVLKNQGDYFEDITAPSGLSREVGWWFDIVSADFDRDGDMDLVAGNLGLNYKYKASEAAPFEIYAKDFDNNGSLDIVLGYHNSGNLYPLRGRECTSNQMPFVKEKFPSYDAFGKATLREVFGVESLEQAVHHQATNFATSYLENQGSGTFKLRPLVNSAQLSSVNSILVEDYNGDGYLDLVIAGNMYGAEVETPRNDAGVGLYLQGDGKGAFQAVSPGQSNLFISGEVKDAGFVRLPGKRSGMLFAKNNDFVQMVEIYLKKPDTKIAN